MLSRESYYTERRSLRCQTSRASSLVERSSCSQLRLIVVGWACWTGPRRRPREGPLFRALLKILML